MSAMVDYSDELRTRLASSEASKPSFIQGRERARPVSPGQLRVPILNPQEAPESVGPSRDLTSLDSHKDIETLEVSGGGNIGKYKVIGAQSSLGSRYQGYSVADRESTDAAVALRTFRAMLVFFSGTKKDIESATDHAIECAKHGIARQIVESIVEKLENESNLHHRMRLFMLVDSITQCSHMSEEAMERAYPPIVKMALPRLLDATAPSGTLASLNRKTCLKVLKTWLELGILPGQTMRHYMTAILAHDDEEPSIGRDTSLASRSVSTEDSSTLYGIVLSKLRSFNCFRFKH